MTSPRTPPRKIPKPVSPWNLNPFEKENKSIVIMDRIRVTKNLAIIKTKIS
jgi:hypothetical protein